MNTNNKAKNFDTTAAQRDEKDELLNLYPGWRLSETNPLNLPVQGPFALLSDDDNEQTAKKIFKALKNDIFFIRMKQILYKHVTMKSGGKTIGDEQIYNSICSALDENNFREILRNCTVNVYEGYAALLMPRSSLDPSTLTLLTARRSQDEPLDFIRSARVTWEEGINEELYAIVSEARRPFCIVRDANEKNLLLEQNCAQSLGQDNVKFLFDSEDILETGLAIQNLNVRSGYFDRYLGMIKLNLNAMDLEEAIRRFGELACHVSQLGLDEQSVHGNGTRYSILRHEEGEAIAASNDILSARYFLRRGCPPSLRAKLWRVSLGLSSEEKHHERLHYELLRTHCHRYDLLTDELLLRDIQMLTDDPRFFVFEDELKEVILSFSRDSWVRKNALYEIHKPIVDLTCDLEDDDPFKSETAPPCGVQPFLGLASYFAPLGYVYRDKVSLFSVSRQLFCKVWCKLNVMSGCRDTLLSVCKTFETLLLQAHPNLFMHLVAINLQPLKVAFPWMQLGFVGLLEMDQLLHLWDRLIGYLDPNILAIAAVAVFVHRAESLMRCNNEADASLVLMEGSRLRIVPLMQMFLYKDTSGLK